MKFKDIQHEESFNKFITKGNISMKDQYRVPLMYLLSLNEATRKHIDEVYDFKNNQIEFDGLNKGWQTGSSTRTTKLAFNLYNDFSGIEDDMASQYTPYQLFDCSDLEYFLYAVELRFG